MKLRRRRSIIVSAFLLLCSGAAVHCGAATPEVRTAPPPEPLIPHYYLLKLATPLVDGMEPPAEPIADLRAKIRASSDQARRVAIYNASLHFLFAGEAATEEGQRRVKHRAAVQMAKRGLRRNENAKLGRSFDFVVLWSSWRGGRQSVRNLVRRFHRDHGDDDELARVVWAILGEFEADNDRWEEANGAWRNLIGDARNPMHAYSLLRTGMAHRAAGDERHAGRALRQVRGYGCHDDAPAEVLRIANLAAVELGETLHLDESGRAMPPICLAGDDEE